jgi:hypothetical protein
VFERALLIRLQDIFERAMSSTVINRAYTQPPGP